MQHKVFEKQLEDVRSETVRNLVIKALDAISEKFFHAGASSTGKYHPDYAVTESGLVKHTKAVVFFVEQLLDANNIDDEYEKSICISAAILHDTCKSGKEWECPFTRHEHPLLVKELLSEDDLTEVPNGINIWNDINELISSHMGKWNTAKNSSVVLPTPKTELQKILHAADYIASRKQISVIDGVTNNGTPDGSLRPIVYASQKQKNLIGVLLNKAGKQGKDTSKYSFIDIEALTAGQASVIIKELKDLTGENEI